MLWETRWRVVPTDEGAWRGLTDPPTALRVALALAVGLAGAALLSRVPGRVRKPVLALGAGRAAGGAGADRPAASAARLPGSPCWCCWCPPWWRLVDVRMRSGPSGRTPSQTTYTRPDPARRCSSSPGSRSSLSCPRGCPARPGRRATSRSTSCWRTACSPTATWTSRTSTRRRTTPCSSPGELEPHTSPLTRPGRAYSIHTPGLAALVLPGLRAGRLCRRASAGLSALTALAAVLVHRVVRRTLGDEALATAAWAVFVFTPPLPFYAMRVYPETAAALGRRRACSRPAPAPPDGARRRWPRPSRPALPWFHPKLLLLSVVGLFLALARPVGWAVRLACAGALAVSVGLLLAHFHAQFGHASLHGGFPLIRLAPSRLAWGVPAVLFDRQFGLFAVSAVFALAVPGTWLLMRRRARRRGRPVARRGSLPGPGRRLRILVGRRLPAGPVRAAGRAGAGRPAGARRCARARRWRPRSPASAWAWSASPPRRPASCTTVRTERACSCGSCRRPSTSTACFPSFFDATAAPLVLSAALAVAGLAAWRWRGAGVVAAAAAFVLVSVGAAGTPVGGPPRRPLSTCLWDWQPERLAGPSGPPPPGRAGAPARAAARAVAPRARETRELAEDRRSSGSLHVPGGDPATADPARMRVELGSGPLVFAQVELDAPRGEAALPVLLPVGGAAGRHLGGGPGGRGRAARRRALVPQALVPRDGARAVRLARDRRARRVTACRRRRPRHRARPRAPEGDGFRVAGGQARAARRRPADGRAVMHVTGTGRAPTDAVEWAGRAIRWDGAR